MVAKKKSSVKKPSKVSIKAEISDDLKKEIKNCCANDCSCNKSSSCGTGMYFLGFVGAAVYFISVAPSFWVGVWGVIKALAWPVLMVYEIMKFLGM